MTSHTFITEGENLPQWSNPISHAVVAGNLCFVSGQLSVSAEGQYIEGSVLDEATLAFKNFFAAVTAAGFETNQIVFVDIAFSDLSQVAIVNTLYTELFPEGKRPARTIYEVAALPFGGKIKVMGTAVKT
ncbi:MAG: RidA family protein [Pseudohongiellaceae bacterium]